MKRLDSPSSKQLRHREYMRDYDRKYPYGKNPVEQTCKACDIKFYARQNKKADYCSVSCAQREEPLGFSCEQCGVAYSVKPSRRLKTRFCSRSCRAAYVASGERHWNWQGGKTEERARVQSTKAYKDWRKAVFERDGYACTECGDSTGGNLEADHIKPFSLYPELRLNLSNGRTLCTDCHKKTDTWGRKLFTYRKELLIPEKY